MVSQSFRFFFSRHRRAAQDLHVLRNLLKKRETVLTKLERAELKRRASKEGEEPKVWTGACFGLGQRVDAVAYLTEELSYYNTEVWMMRLSTRKPEMSQRRCTLIFCGADQAMSHPRHVLEPHAAQHSHLSRVLPVFSCLFCES